MKQRLLFILTVLSTASIILFWVLKSKGITISHSFKIVNLLLVILFIGLLFLNYLNIDNEKNKIIKTLYIIVTTAMTFLILHILLIFSLLLLFSENKEYTANKYTFPNNNKEVLKNIYYSENKNPIINHTIYLVYEKHFILGFKCQVRLNSNSRGDKTFNLKEEYKKLKNKNNGFCNFKLSIDNN